MRTPVADRGDDTDETTTPPGAPASARPLLPWTAARRLSRGASGDGEPSDAPYSPARARCRMTAGRQSEPDFARVFDVAPTPLLLLTPELTVIRANQAMIRATGATFLGSAGRPLFDA